MDRVVSTTAGRVAAREVSLIPRSPSVVAPGAVHLPGWLDNGGQTRAGGGVPCVGRGGGRSPCTPDAEGRDDVGADHLPRAGTGIRTGTHGPWTTMTAGRWPGSRAGSWTSAGARWLTPPPSMRTVLGTDPSGRPARRPRGYLPDVALVNWYGPGARMGMHADRDERCEAPVVSLSLGDSCVFRFGTAAGRGRPWTDVALESGDLFVFGGPARRAYHGVPKVLAGTADPAIGLDGGPVQRDPEAVRVGRLTDARIAVVGTARNARPIGAKCLP